MQRSRTLLMGSWVLATAVATLISAAGVSIVTRDVTGEHSSSLGAAEVVALVGSTSDAPPATAHRPPSSASRPAPPTTTPAVSDRTQEAPDTAPVAEAASATPPPVPVPEPTVTTAAAPPSSSAPAAAPARELPPSKAFPVRGGVLAAACAGDDIALLSARPNLGYQVAVGETGPERIVVRFSRGIAEGPADDLADDERSAAGRVEVACVGGIPGVLAPAHHRLDEHDPDEHDALRPADHPTDDQHPTDERGDHRRRASDRHGADQHSTGDRDHRPGNARRPGNSGGDDDRGRRHGRGR